mmetsp:Transcript_3146/g.6552  ORF Transcript_3146/g.6552 Transcript_3146/m.6552 type:complete len:214 (+) Transcript_3146:294-935(+)
MPKLVIAIEAHTANRTAQRLQSCKGVLKLPEAILMDGVSALQDRHLRCGLEKVLQAHGAVAPHCILHANVGILDLRGITGAAGIAMEVVFTSTNTAKSAFCTVEHLLPQTVIVPKVTFWAEVSCKKAAANFAILCRRLPVATHVANHLGDLRAVDLVGPLTCTGGLVVAVATPEHLVAARRQDPAAPPVVLAAQRSWLLHRTAPSLQSSIRGL